MTMLKVLIIFSVLVYFTECQQVQPISNQIFHKPFNMISVKNNVYWADYLLGAIICYNTIDGQLYIGKITPAAMPWYVMPYKKKPNRFLINDGVKNYIVNWDSRSPTANVIKDAFTVENGPQYVNRTVAFAKVAPNNELVFGTLGTKLCVDQPISSTYRYTKQCAIQNIFSNQILAGAVDWNADGTKMYQISPCESVVREYHYDKKTGMLSQGRIVFTYMGTSQDTLKPVMFDIAVDLSGNLYLACYHAGVVLIVNPKTCQSVSTIPIPGAVVGSVTWGGQNYDTLFVSTADTPRDFYSGTNLPTSILSQGSGKIYAVTGLNAKGFPRKLINCKGNVLV